MFNLLPPDEKKNIHSIYTLRRIDFVLLAFFATGVAANLLLFPSFLLTQIKHSEVKEEISFRQTSLQEKNTGELSTAIDKAKEEIEVLSTLTKDAPTVYELFSKIVARKSEEIKITGILYGGEKNTHEIVVNGIAQNRDALLRFAENVKRELVFSNVSLPVSNFAKNKDIDFSFSIIGDF